MFDSKYGDILTVVLVVVIIAIIGLLGFWAFDVISKNNTESEHAKAIEEFNNYIANNTNNENKIDQNVVENQVVIPDENIVKPDVEGVMKTDTQTVTTNDGKSAKLYGDFVMVGYIQIPRTGINLPILEEVSTASLEKSVAILYGPGLNKPGNTVIVGHNYRNGLFFSKNKQIMVGDKIYITDLNGNKVTYVVYNTYETTPEDSEYMTRDTGGNREISLSTCTDDSSGRIITWARAE